METEGNAVLRFTDFLLGSNTLSFSLAWTTNLAPAKTWVELYSQLDALTNGWQPILRQAVAPGLTNATLAAARTNAATAFYAARLDTLRIDLPGCASAVRDDGTRVFVAEGTHVLSAVVTRAERSDGYSSPDPSFDADPFAAVSGLAYDPATSNLTVAAAGTYELPDGGTLFVVDRPKASFGSPHGYAGTTLSHSSGGYVATSAYPLDSRALQSGWSRGDSPLTGCSCVPSVDFGKGLVFRDDSTLSRSRRRSAGRSSLPFGMRIAYEYEDGGVWIRLYVGDKIVWSLWVEHVYFGYGGSSEELGDSGEEEEEDPCDCGDDEGTSLGSVRFRIPLGSPREGEVSGFLYLDADSPSMPSASDFRILSRGDADVEDITEADGVRTVTCLDRNGRTLVLTPSADADVLTIDVRDTATDEPLHSWYVERWDGALRFARLSLLGNVVSDVSYAQSGGEWTETDAVGGVSTVKRTTGSLDLDGVVREERVTTCAGLVAEHVVTERSLVGAGASAVLRETTRREKGADGAWLVSSASYWDDAAHPRRHGSVRLRRGDDRPWEYHVYDDLGRETFRLGQRDGSDAPDDVTDYSMDNLPPCAAFATVFSYSPDELDSDRTNDCDRVREETRYVVGDGDPVLVARTWTRYVHGETNGYPAVTKTVERAASATAGRGDAGNAVSSATAYDDESGAVPRLLRGKPLVEIDEDGVETRRSHSFVGDALRTVETTFSNGAERPVRRLTVVDADGRLLREASLISTNDVEFAARSLSYDARGRLREVRYDDGTSETNAYSCCRLLWTEDRTGRRRERVAQTGTDRLFHTWTDPSVASLPKDGNYYSGAWSGHGVFKRSIPGEAHSFDGLGRETNVVRRTFQPSSSQTISTLGGCPAVTNATWYPQGVSAVSESLDGRGVMTTKKTVATASCVTTAALQTGPNSGCPAVAATNITIRGGGTVAWRGSEGRWTRNVTGERYEADGTRTTFDVTETSDGAVRTNEVSRHDFLGRVVRREAPLSSLAFSYDGASSRVVSTFDEKSGVATTKLYDAFGEPVGEEAGGVRSLSATTYELVDGDWWRVVRSSRTADGDAALETAVRTRLTGLAGGLRSEVVVERDGARISATRTVRGADGADVETTESAATGTSWTKRLYGSVVEEGSAFGVVSNFYGPFGTVFTRTRPSPSGSGLRQYLDVRETDALGDVVEFAAADRDDLTRLKGGESRGYDCFGNLSAVSNALGETVFRAYDADGNLASVTGDTWSVGRTWNAFGNETSIATTRDGEAQDVTRRTFDAQTGHCTAKIYADGSRATRSWAPDGLELRTTRSDGSWTERVYDANRRLVGLASSDASCAATFANDALGRVVSASNEVASCSLALSRSGEATNETVVVAGEEASVERAFDVCGRRVATRTGGMEMDFVVYGAGGRIAAVSNDEAVVEYVYDALGRDLGWKISFADSRSEGPVFERKVVRHPHLDGEVLVVTNAFGSIVLSFDYGYDALSRPTARNGDAFAYGRRGEVVMASVGGETADYAYDAAGNFASVARAVGGVTNAATFAANALNQYSSVIEGGADLAPRHAANGELAAFGAWTFGYDALSRLTSVCSNGTLVVSNRYDHLGRRVVRISAEGTRRFWYDGRRPVMERLARADGTASETEYHWGRDLSGSLDGADGVGGLLYLKRDGEIYVPFYDAYGNVVAYVDASGSLVASYAYDAFGRTTSQTGVMSGDFLLRQATKPYDAAAGLVDYGSRFYSPELGRWLVRDPLEEAGGANLYTFCGNNPLTNLDPDGRAYFAVRGLGEVLPPIRWSYFVSCPFMKFAVDVAADILNVELVHEQLFYEDGTNIGWGNDEKSLGVGAPILNESKIRYTKKDGGYDDCVMRLAEKMVSVDHYQLAWLGGKTKCNCQDYADMLRAKYHELIKDKETRCKCHIK